jgi:tetratricopeptide (TPR) repeat protein
MKLTLAAGAPSVLGGAIWFFGELSGVDLDRVGILVGLAGGPVGFVLGWWISADGERQRPAASAEPLVNSLPTPAAVQTSSVPVEIGDVPREPKAFQRRPKLYAKIEEIFEAGRAAMVCSLAGAKGVGKTHLAAEYARSRMRQGGPVAWLNAETAEQLRSSLDLMADAIGVRNEDDDADMVARKIKRWLAERQEPYLVVFDNAEDPDAIAPLLPARGAVQVLITTNDHAFERLAVPVEVDRFTSAEALAYLKERVRRTDVAGARRLVADLDRLPLALSIASAQLMGPPSITYDAYRDALRDTPLEQILDRPAGERYPRGVAQAVLHALAGISPDAERLLGELSVISPSGVATDLLGADAVPALRELGQKSLIAVSRDGRTAVAHRLVQRVVRERATQRGVLSTLVEGAAARLHRASLEVPQAESDAPVLTDHARALREHLNSLTIGESISEDSFRTVELSIATLREVVANNLNERSDGLAAMPLAEEVVSIRVRILGNDHPDTLYARWSLGAAMRLAGRSAEAIELLQETARACHEVLGESEDEGLTLIVQNNLALAYQAAGRMAEAVDMFERNLAAAERAGMEGITLFALRNLAIAWASTGRAAEGVELIEVALPRTEQYRGTRHPDTLIAGREAAWVYRLAGRPEEAVSLIAKVLEDQRHLQGADHPQTLISQGEMARCLEAAGRSSEAHDLHEKTLEDMKATMGPDHPLTARAVEDLDRARRLRPQDPNTKSADEAASADGRGRESEAFPT